MLTWMAWTWQTAAFFIFIALCIASMGLLEYIRPGGAARRGVLSLDTTRGDRLFISLIGSAFICLAYLALAGPALWGAIAIAAAYAFCVFRFV